MDRKNTGRKPNPNSLANLAKGKGRPPGVPNKTTANVKAALEEAFERMGGVPKLTEWADENPTEFYKLYAKLLPVHLQGEIKVQGTLADRLQKVIDELDG